jgi:hypothetical protein
VLEACPDVQWQLIIALARYGGFRTPSETLALRWEDVNWETSRMFVKSRKTERYQDRESRMVPIFAELRPYLLAAFDEAEPGDTYCIMRHRLASGNLRTQFLRMIKQAGLLPWPHLFQNLRSSRETELTETFPLHVVTAWLGNSQLIAAKHYLQIRDEDFEKAAQRPVRAAQNAARQTAEPDGIVSQPSRKHSCENSTGAMKTADSRCIAMPDETMHKHESSAPTSPTIPERIRTSNLWLRRPTLYPIELRGREPIRLSSYLRVRTSQAGTCH